MKRRQFCRSAIGAGVIAAHPLAFLNAVHANTDVVASSLSGKEITLESAALRELGEAMNGPVLLSGHPQYDTARKVWNGMHDKRPALIARCQDSRDIQQAVTFARERELLVAVRGGGHSWPGKSVCDGGLMIDLSGMFQVVADPGKRTAIANGGALLGHLDHAALQHNLITTAGVVSHTGVGGFTLGGGFGRLNRKHGLAIDNLLGVEIVTADGKIRFCDAQNEPELFWALRGGGGNFGVASNFKFQLHPFKRQVLSGSIMWPINQAREVLNFYSDWYRQLSDDLYVGPTMATTPDGTSFILMEVVYAGDPGKGEKELAPLRRIGKPMDDGVKVQDYLVMQTQEDAAFHHGVRSYAKNGLVREITPGLIDTMVESFVADPRLAFFTHTAGGAVKRVDELATAFPHRNAETMLIVAGAWEDPGEDESAMRAARQWFSALAPFTGGYYDNIEFEGDGRSYGNYGPAYPRLTKIKGQYDPGNLFRLNSNIEPKI
jgi:FAD binding domain/Berberine and berberine like